jgi:hypothetical protein
MAVTAVMAVMAVMAVTMMTMRVPRGCRCSLVLVLVVLADIGACVDLHDVEGGFRTCTSRRLALTWMDLELECFRCRAYYRYQLVIMGSI